MRTSVSSGPDGGQSFVYHHTHLVTANVLADALRAGRSLEVDIAVEGDNAPYIGHAPIWYESRGLRMPVNLPLDDVVAALENSDIFVVLDCKDARALPRVAEIVSALGADRTLFHSWTDALLFEPYPASLWREPQWPVEDLPFAAIAAMAEQTGVPLKLSCRGLTEERLETEGDRVLDAIRALRRRMPMAIGFTLPGDVLPPPPIVDALLDLGVLTSVQIDVVRPEDRPPIYLGRTEFLDRATPFVRGAGAAQPQAEVA